MLSFFGTLSLSMLVSVMLKKHGYYPLMTNLSHPVMLMTNLSHRVAEIQLNAPSAANDPCITNLVINNTWCEQVIISLLFNR